DFTISFKEIENPKARIVNGKNFPLALSVDLSINKNTNNKQIGEVLREVSATGKFTELLNEYGAVLLRG
ncbi:hypothetical protein B9K06_27500, partial [Bacillus sp. OG2]